ncbi:MAG: hypothetical protein IJV22_03170 [Bacteroidales bacterium]|nr:hypothetical protein [Bacteroidales bacterium]
MKLHISRIATTTALILLTACAGGAQHEAAEASPAADSSTSANLPTYDQLPASLAEAPIPEDLDDVSPKGQSSAAGSSSSTTQAQPSTTAGSRTIYVSTHGAQGEVWGHVRMTGNTGRGTIHDQDENTLSITVTRHGNELYGTDQNGRQYVFKL